VAISLLRAGLAAVAVVVEEVGRERLVGDVDVPLVDELVEVASHVGFHLFPGHAVSPLVMSSQDDLEPGHENGFVPRCGEPGERREFGVRDVDHHSYAEVRVPVHPSRDRARET
jgi:hypothetical protein